MWKLEGSSQKLPSSSSHKVEILSNVRKHLTGGFLCAVLDLSGILRSLLIPEYSGIKRRGNQAFPSLVFQYGDKYRLPSYEPYGKSDCLQLSVFNMDRLCFVSLEFSSLSENNYLVRQYICPHHVD